MPNFPTRRILASTPLILAFVTAAAAAPVLDHLGKAEIKAGVAKVKPAIEACGTKTTARGIVKAYVRVGPDGAVVEVQIKESPEDALADCVARELARATFTESREGARFSYPFRFND